MKKFHFSLQKLMDFREQELDRQKNTLSALQAELKRINDQTEELRLKTAQASAELDEVCARGAQISDIALRKRYIISLQQEIHRMELMAQYLEQHPLELKRGLTQLLDYLDGAGIPAAIATATDIARASEYLKRAGVLERFGRIVCASMVESGKPKPDIYLYAAAQLGLAPQECAALEDSPNGVRSASSAGCVTIMIPDLTQPDDELKALIYAKADSLADVPEILESMK